MTQRVTMSNIGRFSSRRERFDLAFLSRRLKGAKSYKRIAGYFRSSIFELVGEEIAAIPRVQIVCNSELDAADVIVSKHVRETALKERGTRRPWKSRRCCIATVIALYQLPPAGASRFASSPGIACSSMARQESSKAQTI